ncbi:DUF2442 domain-containing protein [Spirosoma sp. HMF4905]|uniref:DUF2442 domain-containing protein n=1 Tax=Spirosoma arboris TaxID=2682092 RepID=A0A7K1S8P5_9BACT|nr:DUF2442 domain-containing protein [Spirosoma arboris]MVM29976.1 DUF2442 domain-containing protein [Spirosoma arboris]
MENRDGAQSKTRVRKNNAKSIKPSLKVVDANFLGDYRIDIHFSDGKQRIVDFENAFGQLQDYYTQYRQPTLFQKFAIDNGNLVWGDDWDVIYSTRDLYEGKIG